MTVSRGADRARDYDAEHACGKKRRALYHHGKGRTGAQMPAGSAQPLSTSQTLRGELSLDGIETTTSAVR
jgi:hypothetical protein